MLRDTAGPPPPLASRDSGRRSHAQREGELRWVWWAKRAGYTRAEMMAALGCSEATVKRRNRRVRRELDWQIGAAKHEEGLALEWEARLETLLAGEVPSPLTPSRELALMEFVERVVRELEARLDIVG